MKRALNNPAVVGVLALVAVFVVYWSAFRKPPYDHLPAGAQPIQNNAQTGKLPGLPEETIDMARVGWMIVSGRSPFGPEKKESPPIEVRESVASESQSPPLTVSAIALEGRCHLAVINGQIFAEGDLVFGREVIRIGKNQVTVSAPSGEELLALFEMPEQTNSASASFKVAAASTDQSDQ